MKIVDWKGSQESGDMGRHKANHTLIVLKECVQQTITTYGGCYAQLAHTCAHILARVNSDIMRGTYSAF